MEDAGRLEVVERPVVVEVGQVGPGQLGVAVGQRLTPGEAGSGGGALVGDAYLVVGIAPAVEGIGEVGQRITDGGDLPVENGLDRAVGADHAVVEPVVAVDHPTGTLLGGPSGQRGMQVVDPVVVVVGPVGRRRPRAVPGSELALDVAVGTTQPLQADGGRIEGVEGGQRLDERPADRGPGLHREVLLHDLGGVEGPPRHLAHDVEHSAGDRDVLAQPVGRRHRHRRRAEGGDDGELAPHVVGLGQQLPQRRSTDDGPPSTAVDQHVGQVRVPALQLLPTQGRRHRIDVLGDPRLDRRAIVSRGLLGRHLAHGRDSCTPGPAGPQAAAPAGRSTTVPGSSGRAQDADGAVAVGGRHPAAVDVGHEVASGPLGLDRCHDRGRGDVDPDQPAGGPGPSRRPPPRWAVELDLDHQHRTAVIEGHGIDVTDHRHRAAGIEHDPVPGGNGLDTGDRHRQLVAAQRSEVDLQRHLVAGAQIDDRAPALEPGAVGRQPEEPTGPGGRRRPGHVRGEPTVDGVDEDRPLLVEPIPHHRRQYRTVGRPVEPTHLTDRLTAGQPLDHHVVERRSGQVTDDHRFPPVGGGADGVDGLRPDDQRHPSSVGGDVEDLGLEEPVVGRQVAIEGSGDHRATDGRVGAAGPPVIGPRPPPADERHHRHDHQCPHHDASPTGHVRMVGIVPVGLPSARSPTAARVWRAAPVRGWWSGPDAAKTAPPSPPLQAAPATGHGQPSGSSPP